MFELFSRTGMQEFCGGHQFRNVPCWKRGCALRCWFIRGPYMVGAHYTLWWFSANSWFVMLDIAGNAWQAFGQHSRRGSGRGKRKRVFPQLLQVSMKLRIWIISIYTVDQKCSKSPIVHKNQQFYSSRTDDKVDRKFDSFFWSIRVSTFHIVYILSYTIVVSLIYKGVRFCQIFLPKCVALILKWK